jgi:hypothetical protein
LLFVYQKAGTFSLLFFAILVGLRGFQTHVFSHLLHFFLWHTKTLLYFRALNNSAEADARRRISLDKQGPTVVHQRPGPLQTIFGLPPDEVSNCCNFIIEFMCYSNDSGPSLKELLFHCLFSFRLLTTVIHVPLRGHFCITAACMSLHGTFAFIQTSFLSRLRLAH